MENLNVSEWFATRAALNIQSFEIEGITFELMALNSEQKEEVELCESYDEMLNKAADYGLSYNRNRVSDDSELSKDIEKLWSLEQLDKDCDPCIKFQVGEQVCKMSGLAKVLIEQLEKEATATKESEEAKQYLEGDTLDCKTLNTTLGELNEDRSAAIQ